MAFLDRLKEELDRAGKAAQGAFDEGKIRLEAFRTRQLADKAAQALGYAVFRAKQNGGDIDADTYARLSATLAAHDAEAARYEAELERKRAEARTSSGPTTAGAPSGSPASDTTSGATAEAPPSAS
jgi:hypothetical protein